MTLRAAVVGCGAIGAGPAGPGLGVQSHAAAWRAVAGADLVAVADPDPDRRTQAMRRWGVPAAYPTLEALLAEAGPDVVSLCSPDPTHAELLDRILDGPSVRGVLAEKPLTTDPAEARNLVQKARERSITLSVNYGRRFLPSHQALRRWLLGGGVGRVRVVTGTYVRGIKHNGTHWIDLARFLVGEIRAVKGRGGGGGRSQQVDDPTIDVELDFDAGARGSLIGLDDAAFALFEMDIIGTVGRVRLVEAGGRFEITAAGASTGFPGSRELVPAPGPEGGIADLLRYPVADLVEALVSGREPACTGEDAVRALTWAAAAIDSRERRHVVASV